MTFRFDKLTTKAQSLVADAQARAAAAENPEIVPLHLMAAMLDEPERDGAKIIRRTADQVAGSSLSERQWRQLLHGAA